MSMTLTNESTGGQCDVLDQPAEGGGVVTGHVGEGTKRRVGVSVSNGVRSRFLLIM